MKRTRDTLSKCNTGRNIYEVGSVSRPTEKLHLSSSQDELDQMMLAKMMANRGLFLKYLRFGVKYACLGLLLPFYLGFIVLPRQVFRLIHEALALCKPPIIKTYHVIARPIRWLVAKIKERYIAYRNRLSAAYDRLSRFLQRRKEAIVKLVNRIFNPIRQMWIACTSKIKQWMQRAIQFIRRPFQALSRVVKKMYTQLAQRLNKLSEGLQAVFKSIGALPRKIFQQLPKMWKYKGVYWASFKKRLGKIYVWVRTICRYCLYLIKEMFNDIKQNYAPEEDKN